MPRSSCRSLLLILAPIAAITGMAGTAGAAALEWSGTLTMRLADLPMATLTGTSVATVNGSGGGSQLTSIFLANSYKGMSAGFQGMTTVPVTDPETTEDNGIVAVRMTITDLGPGVLGGISAPPLSPNQLAVGGLVRLCLISEDCSDNLSTNLIEHTPGSTTNAVGVGGLLTISDPAGTIRVTIEASPWTLGQASLTDQTDGQGYTMVFSTGFAHGPGSNTTSAAATGGRVKFVTPMQVTTNLTAGSAKKMSLFLSMELQFLPEPGRLLLLGSGVVGLLLLGRRRIRP